MKIVFIVSTNGSVLKKAIREGFLADYDIQIISDRNCGAIQFANDNDIENLILESINGLIFSEKLAELFPVNENDLFISFYTRLLSPAFLNTHNRKVINFHPSLLPACPGQRGFEDTLDSGAMFIGSTVHFVDKGVDTGKPVLQAVAPRDPELSVERLRHRVFLQQFISLIQVIRWFDNELINYSEVTNPLSFKGGKYEVGEFSPNLDDDLRKLWESMLFDYFKG